MYIYIENHNETFYINFVLQKKSHENVFKLLKANEGNANKFWLGSTFFYGDT